MRTVSSQLPFGAAVGGEKHQRLRAIGRQHVHELRQTDAAILGALHLVQHLPQLRHRLLRQQRMQLVQVELAAAVGVHRGEEVLHHFAPIVPLLDSLPVEQGGQQVLKLYVGAGQARGAVSVQEERGALVGVRLQLARHLPYLRVREVVTALLHQLAQPLSKLCEGDRVLGAAQLGEQLPQVHDLRVPRVGDAAGKLPEQGLLEHVEGAKHLQATDDVRAERVLLLGTCLAALAHPRILQSLHSRGALPRVLCTPPIACQPATRRLTGPDSQSAAHSASWLLRKQQRQRLEEPGGTPSGAGWPQSPWRPG
mmetsp:Transcript_32085/g.83123  ORF Transcript_32085/g.83123 Transcript_32085/m.83123 type:complete len:310 (+) Transcript_32085:190-1119(+)